jgi:hypothetical protein
MYVLYLIQLFIRQTFLYQRHMSQYEPCPEQLE